MLHTLMPVSFVGFDSAWTDNPKSPGAICSIDYDGGQFSGFKEPTLVPFSQALDFVRGIDRPGQLTLVAIDQPTIVPNQSSMRPAERVAASAISWLGGGVQPANRARVGMFDDGAPIWSFLRDLGATEDPERARLANVQSLRHGSIPRLGAACISRGLLRQAASTALQSSTKDIPEGRLGSGSRGRGL
jgi:predicted RNase H-like nuclease